MRNEELREFLTTRRARITPARAGLPETGGARRVAGLRRAEVADLAGISAGYYRRLERGAVASVSTSVMTGVGRALQLDGAERDHLADLLRWPRGRAVVAHPAPAPTAVLPFVRRLLDATALPCCVLDDRLDLLAANDLAQALYHPLYAGPGAPENLARFVFLDRAARDFWSDWPVVADLVASLLRTGSGRDPLDADLVALVRDLRARSAEFRTRWAAHEVAGDASGTREIRHPVVGRLTLEVHALTVPDAPGQHVVIHAAAHGSASQRRLDELADWAEESRRTDRRDATSGKPADRAAGRVRPSRP
ncbi:helix-turn-helix transcriptional regulator [Cellulosimicrobium sp. Marseille-Q4280]|uniref:helix-turn-helix transcriptional regulator n=1 Tax=Cellulosimicrobium sp. Marseille-Q4280 TaxID=2937992 RepID=UPI00203E75FE|nr:helix-turn-helix transcriptional regulator [Cellulosimicrobium sp. Marseille-Q4280]